MTNTISLNPEDWDKTPQGVAPEAMPTIPLEAQGEMPTISLGEPEKPKKLSREEILADPKNVDTIRRGLQTMYGKRKSFVHSDFEEMDEEELFETWQNWQRYFSVGNSVTTAKTALKAFDGDDVTKATLDENFRLFDSMESGFKGDFWDTVWDYGRGAVVDPMTVVSMGVGKALSTGGTKAANLAVKEAVKQAATSTARKAAVRAGRTQLAAAGAKEALRYSSVDIAANMAMDVAQQATRMETGTQEEYSALQTMISGVASAGIPAILGASAASRAMSRSEWAKGTVFESYTDELAKHDLSKEGLMKVIKDGAPRPEAQASVADVFKGLGGDEGVEIINWGKAKEELPEWFLKEGRPKGDGQKTQLYFNQLFFGNKNSKGFVNYLVDEKIPFDKKLFADEQGKGGTSGFIFSTLDLLDDKTVKKLSGDFRGKFR